MTNQEIDDIECAIRHIQTAVDVDPWAVEIAVEAMKTQLSAEGTTSDLISRQAAIDALDNIKIPRNASWYPYYQQALTAVSKLPSAQLENEERKEESAQNVPKEDLISRKAAIDAVRKCSVKEVTPAFMLVDKAEVMTELMMLPSAQPETAKRIVGKSRNGMTLWYQCDMCNEPVDAQDNFCRGCGRRLTDG